jgi:hypothetical protein
MSTAFSPNSLIEVGRYNPARSQLFFSYGKALSSGRPPAPRNFFAGNITEFPPPCQNHIGRVKTNPIAGSLLRVQDSLAPLDIGSFMLSGFFCLKTSPSSGPIAGLHAVDCVRLCPATRPNLLGRAHKRSPVFDLLARVHHERTLESARSQAVSSPS